MKPARTFQLLVALFLVAVTAMALAVYAGTPDDPEVGDSSNDADTGRDSHDIIAAWVHDEDNETVTFRMRLTALDAISPLDDWTSLPTSIYEYYFSVGDDDYALRASVPVHGPLAAFAGFSLYSVEYGETGNMSFDSIGSVSGSYLVNEGDLSFMVDKANIGSPTQGELIEHMWAAVYFQPRGGSREEVDTALSYEFPGRAYVVRGQYTQLYDIRLSAANTTVEAPNNAVASFNITIKSMSTIDVEVNLTNRSLPAGYFVNWSRTLPVIVPEGGQITVLLMVTVPENATNGTDVMVTVWGEYTTEEGVDLVTDNLNLLVQVRFIPPKKPKPDRGVIGMVLDFIDEYRTLVILLVVVAIVAVLAWFYTSKKRKQEDHLLDEYKAYLESQGEQRDLGGM
jgi:hypothetical protein